LSEDFLRDFLAFSQSRINFTISAKEVKAVSGAIPAYFMDPY